MMHLLISTLSSMFLIVVGIEATTNTKHKNHLIETELSTSLHRRLDISKQCLDETIMLWESEVVKWRFPWTTECDDSPCDYEKAEPEYYNAYKAQCKVLGGKFVEYTYKFPEELYSPGDGVARQLLAPFFLVVYNHPDCISKSCDANQFASFLQGIDHVEQDNAYIYVYDQTMISKQCLDETMELESIQPLSPYNLGCDEYPCDASNVAPENYASVKAECKSLGGQFVEFTVKFEGNNAPSRKLEDVQSDYEVNNYPDCIGQTCDAYQLTSYLQGAFNYGMTENTTYFITQTSSTNSFVTVSLGSLVTVTISFILLAF